MLNEPDGIDVVFEPGSVKDTRFGLAHNWQHHKEVFTDPAAGERILRATLDNPRARVSVTYSGSGKDLKKFVAFYDPASKSYCVGRLEAGKLRLMSYHRADDVYSDHQAETR